MKLMRIFLLLALVGLAAFSADTASAAGSSKRPAKRAEHSAKAEDPVVAAAREAIIRTAGRMPENLLLERIDAPAGGADCYTLEAADGVLHVGGTSPVAICRGFCDYLVTNGYGVVNWTGSRIDLPARFPDLPLQRTESPFRHRLYMNVCTLGYTAPFWDWERWEREIDWMAMHGFDMPLAPIAGEAILARVWRRMGLTDAEIDAYFTGPAHMPWMRMGNMTELDGAPSPAWHEAQIALQHRIVDRMRALGMKPVFQGFAGFVPEAMQRLYPDMKVTETKWAGLHSWLLDPLDPRFGEIGTAFIREWEAEFGKGEYYLIDCFNELDVPFGDKGTPERARTLRNYSSTIYNSLREANPDATWVMQGWMFGYQRHIWDPQSVEALLSGVPGDRMIVLDLAVDFNRYIWRSALSWDYLSGFFGKEWIYSTVPNFGGRTALTGALEFYANGHLAALDSPDRGKLTGYGTSPEGVENNEVIYEVIAAAGWSDRPIDLQALLHRYSVARYGSADADVDAFWREMTQSAYGTFTNNARFRWQIRPAHQRCHTMGINDHYYTAIERFLAASERLGGSELYRTDALQYAAFYLCAKAEECYDAINRAYGEGDTARAAQLEARCLQLLADADRLLASHPILRTERWFAQAEAAGTDAAESRRHVEELRRLITTWGGPSLYDYAARVWSGVIRDFYIPRLEHYFALKREGRPGDFPVWDEQWRTGAGLSAAEPFADPLANACRLVHEAAGCRPLEGLPEAAALWSPYELVKANQRISFSVPCGNFERMKGLRLVPTRGSQPVTVARIQAVANHCTRIDSRCGVTVDPAAGSCDVLLDKLPADEPLSKEVTFYLTFEAPAAADNYARIEMIY